MGSGDKLGRKPAMAAKDKAKMQEVAASLGRGKSLRKAFTWPGGTAKLELRVLADSENRGANRRALAAVQHEMANSAIPRNEADEALEAAKARQILAKACMVPETDKPFFDSADELGDIATTGELQAVYVMYLQHCDMVDPALEDLSEEQLDVIDEAIKKKATASLKSIASDLPRSSLLILVNRLCDSLTDSSTNT